MSERGIAIDSRPARQGANEVKGILGEIETSAQRMTRNIQTDAATLGVAFGARQLIEYADAFKQIEGRLALVTRGTADLERTQRALVALAASGTGLSTVIASGTAAFTLATTGAGQSRITATGGAAFTLGASSRLAPATPSRCLPWRLR